MLDALRALPTNGGGPRIVGAHVEGPFLSEERLGTHPREHRRDPDLALLDRLLDAGRVTEFTLAPELPGAGALIGGCSSGASSSRPATRTRPRAEAHAAFDLGVSTVSHLFNAMRPVPLPRPGDRRRRAHAARRLRADDRRRPSPRRRDGAARLGRGGRPPRARQRRDGRAPAIGGGTYQLGDVEIEVAGGVPMREDGVFAGTVLTMIDAVRNLHALGIPFEDAVGAATSVPARDPRPHRSRRARAGRSRPTSSCSTIGWRSSASSAPVRPVSWLEAELREQPRGARAPARAAGRSTPRSSPRAFQPRGHPLHPDRLARQLVATRPATRSTCSAARTACR